MLSGSSMLRSSLCVALLIGVAALAPSADAQTRKPVCEGLAAAVKALGEQSLAKGAPGLVMAVDVPGREPVIAAFGSADLEAQAPMRAGAVFKIASLTKQFTAAAVLALTEDGLLDLDRPAVAYLPEHAFLGDITTRQLLIQTSGLADYAQAVEESGAKSASRSPAQMAALISALKPPRTFAAGEAWAYSNSNYVILGLLIEKLSGQSFETFLESRILARAGMTSSAVDHVADIVPGRVRGYSRASRAPLKLRNADWIDPSVPGPAGALRATAPDLLSWSRSLFSGAIISRQSLDAMTAPGRLSDGRTTRHGMPAAWREGLKADYAMGLFRSASPLGDRLWHSGDIEGFSTWMAHYPQKGVTLVILMNADFLDLDTAGLEAAAADRRLCPAA
ncbi:serine hydrolase domain-containing protein [Caulobacter sp. 73W]|uniref:Serine hydrolase domain-containing protein n=1 Tax=Caulobacter sp. 73W TaxID=3161137 RepID=A0AB39KXH9_9CAUL